MIKISALCLLVCLSPLALGFDEKDWQVRCWNFESRRWEPQDIASFSVTRKEEVTEITNKSGIHKHAHFVHTTVPEGDFTFTIELKGGYELGFLNQAGKDEMLYIEVGEQKDFETFELSRQGTRLSIKRNGRERPLVHFKFDYGETFLVTLAVKEGESALIRSYSFQNNIKSVSAPHPDSILIAAHRGGYRDDKKDNAPENSLANLELAIRKGFDLYETDIRCTSDGKFVIVHDDTLDRETDGKGPVENLTLDEVKQLRKRFRDGSLSEHRVATFEELLTAGKGRIAFKPDLKDGVLSRFPELSQLIHRLGMEDDVFLRTGLKSAPEIKQHYSEGVPEVEIMFKANTIEQVKKVIKDFSPKTIQINISKDERLTEKKREAIRFAVNRGVIVETHSYGNIEQREALIAAGVRMFHTATPDDLKEWLRDRGN